MRGFLSLFGYLFALKATATILPPNDLHLEKGVSPGEVTEEDFNEVIQTAEDYYADIVASHGASLKINRLWENNTVNANATRSGRTWIVNMYGGLARRPEVTKDGFALVVCHELGHHLGGWPKVGFLFNRWAANEGQSDYFATMSCARNLWKQDFKLNAAARDQVHPYAKDRCDETWESEDDRNLCYRISLASFSLASLLARGAKIAFDTPDKKKVRRTFNSHPKGQCRLDTMMAGSICTEEFDVRIIPRNKSEARQSSCMRVDDFENSARPRCWFAP